MLLSCNDLDKPEMKHSIRSAQYNFSENLIVGFSREDPIKCSDIKYLPDQCIPSLSSPMIIYEGYQVLVNEFVSETLPL